MTNRNVYITGAGIISAIGGNKAEVLSSLLAERSGVGAVRHLQTEHTELPVGEVRESNEELKSRLNLSADLLVNRTALMGAVAAREAIAEAALKDDELTQAFFISGNTVGGMDITERYFLEMQYSDDHLAAYGAHDSGTTSDITAGIVGIGQSRVITISTACSSAANSIIMAANLIKTGRADIVVAGGSESLSKFHLNGFNTLMILDHEQCRPFDATRKGLNLGEGAAYVVLESAASAERRGVKPLAELVGYGNACDAHHQTASSEDGEGAFLAMTQALRMSGIAPDEIDYLNAHGTGTPNNDQSESVAIQRVFGECYPPVSSTKSFTGHTTSASGSIETVICLLALQNGFIPCNLGWSTPMENGIRPSLGQRDVNLHRVMCNSFGFGGNDSSLILSKVGEVNVPTPVVHHSKVYVKAISTLSAEQTNDRVREFIAPMEARRMCKLMKAAMVTSLDALRQAGVECPDAIIAGTTLGMHENSEKFLLEMTHEGEHCLGPTLFMLSTHNTIAGALGIRTKCHGYNTTFTQSDHSIRAVLLDALLQFELQDVENVLVGYHDESTETYAALMQRLTGIQIPVGQSSASVVLSTNAENALCELDIDALSAQLDPVNVLYPLTSKNNAV